MSYGIFIKSETPGEMAELSEDYGQFALEDSAIAEAEVYKVQCFDPEDYDAVYVARICYKHDMPRDDQECECWYDGPYSDDRGDFGPGVDNSARI